MKKIELLAPAGDLERLKIAVMYGADAVYLGGKQFSLRSRASNFDIEDIAEGVKFAKQYGAHVHVTVNMLPHEEDIEGLKEYLMELERVGVTAIIVASPMIMMCAKKYAPKLEVHVSTQHSSTNASAANYWKKKGMDRVVLAREVTLKDIKDTMKNVNVPIEVFVHGAMCISYSGRCLLSNFFTGRDANQGACTHPCRWKYSIVEETRPGEYMPVYENERGTYIFNSKDLCMIEHIPDLIDAGIDSLKIEGRMKTALYVATVARTYRKALDDCQKDPALYEANMEWYKEEIGKCTYREFTTGFYYGKPDETAQIYDNNTYIKNYTYLGTVEDVDAQGRCRIEQRNKFSVGEMIEIMKPDGRNVQAAVKAITDEEGHAMESAPHPKQVLFADLGTEVKKYDILRRKE